MKWACSVSGGNGVRISEMHVLHGARGQAAFGAHAAAAAAGSLEEVYSLHVDCTRSEKEERTHTK